MTLINILVLLFLLLTILGFLRLRWWMTAMDFPRLQYAVIGFILLLTALFSHNMVGIIGSIIIVCLNLYRIRHFLPGLSLFHRDHTPHEKDIMSVNAYKDNKKPEKLAQVIKDFNPALLLIMEMTDDMQNALNSALSDYAHKLETPVRDGFRICLYSKVAMEDTNIDYHGEQQTPLLSAKVKLCGRVYQVFSAHPKPILNKQWHKERLQYFTQSAPTIARSKHPVIIMGDFNAVPWENAFQKFMTKTGLKSTLNNHGYLVTWPVFFWPMGIPMDHILISDNEYYSDLKVGPYVGSDHYPISLNLKQCGT